MRQGQPGDLVGQGVPGRLVGALPGSTRPATPRTDAVQVAQQRQPARRRLLEAAQRMLQRRFQPLPQPRRRRRQRRRIGDHGAGGGQREQGEGLVVRHHAVVQHRPVRPDQGAEGAVRPLIGAAEEIQAVLDGSGRRAAPAEPAGDGEGEDLPRLHPGATRLDAPACRRDSAARGSRRARGRRRSPTRSAAPRGQPGHQPVAQVLQGGHLLGRGGRRHLQRQPWSYIVWL